RVAVDQAYDRVVRAAQTRGVLDDGVEYGPDVGRRPRDDAQDLGGRRLLLERLLDLFEQARVLDRDDRLVGERLQARNLRLGRVARIAPGHDDHADRHSIAQDRHAEHASPTPDGGGDLVILGIVQRVCDVHHLTADDYPAADRSGGGRARDRKS